jgi:AraC family transcriptional regulator
MEKTQIDKAKKFIHSHLREDFTLDELAKFVGYSAYHFAREFKADTGKTVMEYTRESRLNAAADELAIGKGVFNTALEFGFETYAGFTKDYGDKNPAAD